MIEKVEYSAPLWCRNKHIQSLLATVKLRKKFVKARASKLLKNSQEIIIDCGQINNKSNVQLQSFYAKNKNENAPLVVLIHGWEGSHESLYLLSSANALYQVGYHVLRLNLRDHGTSHHLNKELFHSNRLQEVVNAVAKIQQQFKPSKLFLCGFSLGGNFALRVANEAKNNGIHLAKVIAICPALDPEDILHKLENSLFIYIKYFMLKWTRSLRQKQQLFPEFYDFNEQTYQLSMRDLTHKLVGYYGEYPTIKDYFDGYNIIDGRLNNLSVPCDILLAKDDPIIDYQGIHHLPYNDQVKLFSSEHGGHCGFIKNIKLHSWLDDFIVEHFSRITND